MRRFTIFLISLLLGILAMLYLLDFAYTYVYTAGLPRNKISYLLSLKNEKIDYVFLGSSRVDNTIDSDIIEVNTGKTALNLGIQGAKPDDYFLMLKLLHEQNIQTKAVFIQVDYVFNLEGNSEILKSALMPFISKPIISEFVEERSNDYFFLKNIPFYRYLKYDYKLGFREFTSTLLHRRPGLDLDNGYTPKYGQAGGQLKSELPERLKEKNETLQAINNFAVNNNIKIYYFMAPFCPATLNQNFGSKLQEKIPGFIDFSNIFKDHEEYFFNCGHLNDKGAKKFSQIIAERINTDLTQ